MSDNTSNVVKNPTLSDADAEKLLTAIAAMFPIVKNCGKALESFDGTDLNCIAKVCVRAHDMLQEHTKARREAEVRQYRTAVENVIVGAVREAKAARAEYDNMLQSASPALRAILSQSAPSDYVNIPLSDFGDCFAEGTSKETMVAILHKLNYRLAAGRQDESGPKVSVPLVAKTTPVPPNRQTQAA